MFLQLYSNGVPVPSVLLGPMWISTTPATNKDKPVTVSLDGKDSTVLNVSFVSKGFQPKFLVGRIVGDEVFVSKGWRGKRMYEK